MSIETERRLVNKCLAQIQGLGFMEARFVPLGDEDRGVDGLLRIYNETIDCHFSVLVKANLSVSRASAITSSYRLMAHNLEFIVITESISPGAATMLKKHEFNYIDTLGNMFIKTNNVYIHTVSNKKTAKGASSKNLLNSSAIKLISYFLSNPTRVNEKYREISKETGVALGSIGGTVASLRERGYLRLVGKNVRLLTRRQDLLERWVAGYHEKLRPKLSVGRFRSIKHKNINEIYNYISAEREDVLVGGEFAASMLLDWLHPATITLHCFSDTDTIVRELGLVSDPEGPITLLEGFGDINAYRLEPNARSIASPLIVYAEISDSSSERVQDAARDVFARHLKGQIDEG